MTTVRYIGPFDAVDIPDLGVSVARGESFECDEGAAASLSAQTDFVIEAPTKATKATATKSEED